MPEPPAGKEKSARPGSPILAGSPLLRSSPRSAPCSTRPDDRQAHPGDRRGHRPRPGDGEQLPRLGADVPSAAAARKVAATRSPRPGAKFPERRIDPSVDIRDAERGRRASRIDLERAASTGVMNNAAGNFVGRPRACRPALRRHREHRLPRHVLRHAHRQALGRRAKAREWTPGHRTAAS